jgi:hypothetical protein
MQRAIGSLMIVTPAGGQRSWLARRHMYRTVVLPGRVLPVAPCASILATPHVTAPAAHAMFHAWCSSALQCLTAVLLPSTVHQQRVQHGATLPLHITAAPAMLTHSPSCLQAPAVTTP